MRDAVSLLDQLLSYGDDILTLARVERVLGLVNAQTIGTLVDCIAANDTAAGLTLINRLVADGVELGQLVDQIVAYLARRPVHAHGPNAGAARSAAGRDPDRHPPGPGLHAGRVIGRGARVHGSARGAARSGARRPAVTHRVGVLARGGCNERTGRDRRPGRGDRPGPQQRQRHLRQSMPRPQHRRSAQGRLRRPHRPPLPRWHHLPPSSLRGTQPAVQPRRGRRPRCQTTSCARPFRPTGSHSWAWQANAAAFRCRRPCARSRRSRQSGDAVILRFSHTFSRDLVNRPENRSQVEALWEELLKARVQVRCALVGETVAAPSPTASSQSRTTGAEQTTMLSWTTPATWARS